MVIINVSLSRVGSASLHLLGVGPPALIISDKLSLN
jgi:hypothetical protein